MKQKYFLFYFIFLILVFYFLLPSSCFAVPGLITTLSNAFKTIESWLLKLATPAAAVAVGTGIFMKKFSFGDEEKIRTGKHIIRGALFSYVFILLLDMILSAIQTLIK